MDMYISEYTEETMSNQSEFLDKLNGLLRLAQKKGAQITIEEVKAYFSEDALTEEQMGLVFDYLMAQKIVVKGYIKMSSGKMKTEYTEEEKLYLKQYEKELKAIQPTTPHELNALLGQVVKGEEAAKNRVAEIYLSKVVEIAKELRQPEVFIGDLIQEGNLGLVLAMEMITDSESADDVITAQIKQKMQLLLEEQSDLTSKDKKMVEKVQTLDESIQTLTEELGRKVTIDELAIYMGLQIEEIENILKLAGEEPEEEKE